MPRDVSGNYTLPGGNPVVTGTLIESTWANSTMADIADALTNSLSRNGNGGMLAPLRFPDGTAIAPSIAFNTAPATGLFYTTNQLNFSVNGTNRLWVNETSLFYVGDTLQIRTDVGNPLIIGRPGGTGPEVFNETVGAGMEFQSQGVRILGLTESLQLTTSPTQLISGFNSDVAPGGLELETAIAGNVIMFRDPNRIFANAWFSSDTAAYAKISQIDNDAGLRITAQRGDVTALELEGFTNFQSNILASGIAPVIINGGRSFGPSPMTADNFVFIVENNGTPIWGVRADGTFTGGFANAVDVAFDNTLTPFAGSNVQEALDEMGTAALATLQTSATDATAGRLGTANDLVLDPDTITDAGFYRYQQSWPDNPDPSVAGVIVHNGISDPTNIQMAISLAGDVYTRVSIGGVFGAWSQVGGDVGPDLLLGGSIATGGTDLSQISNGGLSLNSTVPGYIMSLRSDYANHGMTSIAPTELVQRTSIGSAIEVQSFANLYFHEMNAISLNNSFGAVGAFNFVTWLKSGTSSTTPGANDILFNIQSGAVARLQVAGDGHTWVNGDLTVLGAVNFGTAIDDLLINGKLATGGGTGVVTPGGLVSGGIQVNSDGDPGFGFSQVFTDANIAHGVTAIYPNNAYGIIAMAVQDQGGLAFSGITETALALAFTGVSTNHPVTPYDVGMITVSPQIKSLSSTVAPNPDDVVFSVMPLVFSPSSALMNLLGDGRMLIKRGLFTGGRVPSGTEDPGSIHVYTGSADGLAQRFINDDVAHGATAFLPTNVYAAIGKAASSTGGFGMWGASELNRAFYFQAAAGSPSTSAFGVGIVDFLTQKISGVNVVAPAANESVFTVSTDGVTRVLALNGEGSLFLRGSGILGAGVLPANNSTGMLVSHTTASHPFSIALTNSNVAHPFTAFNSANVFCDVRTIAADIGGVWQRGYSETNCGMYFSGVSVTPTTVVGDGSLACMVFDARITNGATSAQALAATDIAFKWITNGSSGTELAAMNGAGDLFTAGSILTGGKTTNDSSHGAIEILLSNGDRDAFAIASEGGTFTNPVTSVEPSNRAFQLEINSSTGMTSLRGWTRSGTASNVLNFNVTSGDAAGGGAFRFIAAVTDGGTGTSNFPTTGSFMKFSRDAGVSNFIEIMGSGDINTDGGIALNGAAASTGALAGKELSADPANPAEGEYVLWMSDGTGSGDDGDIMIKRTANSVTDTLELGFDTWGIKIPNRIALGGADIAAFDALSAFSVAPGSVFCHIGPTPTVQQTFLAVTGDQISHPFTDFTASNASLRWNVRATTGESFMESFSSTNLGMRFTANTAVAGTGTTPGAFSFYAAKSDGGTSRIPLSADEIVLSISSGPAGTVGTPGVFVYGDHSIKTVGGVSLNNAGRYPGALAGKELSADPADPAEGEYVLWMSDGTGSGDDGDIMLKITAGAVTKTVTLVDFSAV